VAAGVALGGGLLQLANQAAAIAASAAAAGGTEAAGFADDSAESWAIAIAIRALEVLVGGEQLGGGMGGGRVSKVGFHHKTERSARHIRPPHCGVAVDHLSAIRTGPRRPYGFADHLWLGAVVCCSRAPVLVRCEGEVTVAWRVVGREGAEGGEYTPPRPHFFS
jgi:hypothetical protein